MRKSLTHREGVERETEREDKSERARRREEGEHRSANDFNHMKSGGVGGVGVADRRSHRLRKRRSACGCFLRCAFVVLPPYPGETSKAHTNRGDKQGAHKQG